MVCRFLESAELAIALLIISVGLLAWATLLDSARGSEIAQWYFYHSRWFIALMVLLVINVLVATILRWPWKKRHIGFLVTHFGLIVLLAGSTWGFVGGIEGRLTFAEGEAADTILVSDRSQLTLSWREGGSKKELIFTFAPGPVDWPVEEPLDFGESDGFRVKVLRFYRHARREVSWIADASGHATRKVTFQPVAFAPGESEAPEAAALLEIAAGGETHRVWLQRGRGQHGFQRIQTPKGPAAISFGYAQRSQGFSLRGYPKSPPLPLGEGRGEGALVKRQKLGSQIPCENPHPNPLPEGEGT